MLREDGKLLLCGYNFHGAFGTNDKMDRVNFTKFIEDVADISAISYHSLPLKKDDSLWKRIFY